MKVLSLYATTEEEVLELKAYLARTCPTAYRKHDGIVNTSSNLWVQLGDSNLRSWQPGVELRDTDLYPEYFSNCSTLYDNIHIYAYLYPDKYPEYLL